MFRFNSKWIREMIVFHLCRKGMPLDAAHDDLVHTLGAEAMASSTVTECARSANFVFKKDVPSDEPATIESSLVDDAVLTALAEPPFSSVGKLFEGTWLP
jgi:hypothetical protein